MVSRGCICIATLVALASIVGVNSGCTVQHFIQEARECVHGFVDEYKKTPSVECSLRYNILKNCTHGKMTNCLRGHVDNRTSLYIRQYARIYTAHETFFCDNGMLNAMENYTPAALPTCSKKFFKRISKCKGIFLKRYRKNRGSATLCRRYYKARSCIIRALSKHCKASPTTSSFIAAYKNPYNPYCYDRRDPITKNVQTKEFGGCTQQGFVTQSRGCITNFVHALQRSKGQNCRDLVSEILLKCMRRKVKRCLRRTRDDKTLDRDISTSFNAQRTQIQTQYCEGGYLETLPLAAGQCTKEYFNTFQGKCNTKFISKFRANRADPHLCWEYAEVKKCARNMTLSHCTLDKDMKESVLFLYGEFNPFCPNSKDPEDGTRRYRRHEKQTTSTKNGSMATAHASCLLLLTICILFGLVL